MKITNKTKIIAMPTLEIHKDEIYLNEEQPIGPELEDDSEDESENEYTMVLHKKLRKKVLHEILPNLFELMHSHNDVKVELRVETDYPHNEIFILLSTDYHYDIKTLAEAYLIKANNGYVSHCTIMMRSKETFIDCISRDFARDEFKILIAICEYFEKVLSRDKYATRFLETY